jgi:putative transposase
MHTPSIDIIWEKIFYDFNIYSHKKLLHKLNYIHNNPVRARLASKPTDYLYFSTRNYYLNDNSLIEIDYIGL